MQARDELLAKFEGVCEQSRCGVHTRFVSYMRGVASYIRTKKQHQHQQVKHTGNPNRISKASRKERSRFLNTTGTHNNKPHHTQTTRE